MLSVSAKRVVSIATVLKLTPLEDNASIDPEVQPVIRPGGGAEPVFRIAPGDAARACL
jgi:hypothetical protein